MIDIPQTGMERVPAPGHSMAPVGYPLARHALIALDAP